MAYANFKPVIWSKYIEHELKKFTVFKEDCDYRFEGEVGKGKTVKILGVGKPTIGDYKGTKINDPEAVPDSSVTLEINQAKYFNFMVDDVDAAQAQEGLMPALMEEATRALAYEGLLYPASDVIDFSRSQWNQNVKDLGTINGKTFFFVNEPNNIENLVRFRPDYLDTYGIENPYDLIKEGKWTTDKYLEIAQKITQLGAANSVYGANKVNEEPNLSLVLALFGTYWVGTDEEGYYYSNLDDIKIIEALNWLTKLNETAPPKDVGDAVTVFNYPTPNTGLGVVSDKDPNQENKIYWCDPPMSSHITETPNLCQSANVRGMPMLLGDERAKQVGTIYARYCEPLGDTPEETARLDADGWYPKTYNKESAEVIMAYRERGSEILVWHLSGGIWDNISKPMKQAIDNGQSYASVIESLKDTWEGYLDEKNKDLDI